jgi:D-galactarolactone isomerase
MHFYSDAYPTASTALMTPPNAWVDDYRAVQRRLGLDRVVVVQPTTYGMDNRCLLDAMEPFGDKARGIVVPDPSISDAELQELSDAGVCGVRFHMLPGGALDWGVFETVAARVHSFGWHIQLQMNGREFPEREALLRNIPCDLVVDHVGRFMGPVTASDEAFKILLGFLERGRCWVKLSAPYESSKSGPPGWEDVGAEARELARFAPERMLWASNWPHPGQPDPPDEADLLDLLLDWVDDASTRTMILRDNPAELYSF